MAAPQQPQQPLTEPKKKSVRVCVGQFLNINDFAELAADVEQLFAPHNHAGVGAEILNFALDKSPKDSDRVATALAYLVSSGTVSADNLRVALTDFFEVAPELYLDVPNLYECLAKFVAPLIEQEHVSFEQILKISETIISSKQGHFLLRAVITVMKEYMGPTFALTKWKESGLQINQWMSEDQVSKFVQDNGFEFLEGAKANAEAKKVHAETQE